MCTLKKKKKQSVNTYSSFSQFLWKLTETQRVFTDDFSKGDSNNSIL